jgi:hypothetical protein
MIVDALRTTFDESYPEPDFQNAYVSIEYPINPQAYPSVFVDYEDDDPLVRAGVDHHETVNIGTDLDPVLVQYTRWLFKGTATFTVVALSSLERDRLFDQMVRVISFGSENPYTNRFRTEIESNDFIAANMDFDTLAVRGNAAAPGTPWGTDEVIYERGVNATIQGEFFINPTTGELILLSAVQIARAQELTGPDSLLTPLADEENKGTTVWY